jgi:AraC-like DNA-binding protein
MRPGKDEEICAAGAAVLARRQIHTSFGTVRSPRSFPGIEGAARFDQEQLHLTFRTRPVFDAPRNDEHFTRRDRDHGEAAARLKRGQTVSRVAFDLGYETVSGFCHAYRSCFGETPGSARA